MVREYIFRKRTAIAIILWLFVALWLIVFTSLSSQEGTATSKTSILLSIWILRFFHLSFSFLNQINSIMRTVAHFGIFFIFYFLLHFAVLYTWPTLKSEPWIVGGICCFVAIMDEVKKLWIPGRHLHWRDVGLNLSGIVLGIVLSLVIKRIVIKHKKSKPNLHC